MADIEVHRIGAVGHIVISHPEKYNAMTLQMWRDLPLRIAELDADPKIRAIVLRGDGEKAFVSGADISQFGDERSDPLAQQNYKKLVDDAYLAPVRANKPTIAQIQGICIGGGLGLAAGCDIRICADNARFRMPAARLGLGYDQAGLQRFVALIGVQNTYDIFYSARNFDAQEALRMGFVTRVVAPAQLSAVVLALTDAIAENAPLTLKAAKLSINAFLQNSEPLHTGLAQQAIDACNSSLDYAEGVRAFAEKRKPRFSGR
ncbi:MAG: enoyl-CoA hydratase [Burkholderiaceae bacterium]